MKQYYNKILIGENVTTLKTFQNDSIDLTVTSPPYDLMRTYNKYSWDYKALIKQLYRVTKPGGVVVWVIGDQTVNGGESGSSFIQALEFMNAGFLLNDTMIYEKAGIPNPQCQHYYFQVFEYMFVFNKGKLKTFNPIRDRKTTYREEETISTRRQSDGTMSKVKRSRTQEFGLRRNVWRYGNSTSYKKAFDHPAIFPEKLARDHIISWSKQGDVILDPFMGSGTTAIAAMRTKRIWIGIEISEKYVNEIAIPRIKYEKKRTSKRIGRK